MCWWEFEVGFEVVVVVLITRLFGLCFEELDYVISEVEVVLVGLGLVADGDGHVLFLQHLLLNVVKSGHLCLIDFVWLHLLYLQFGK